MYIKVGKYMEMKQKLLIELQIAREIIDLMRERAMISMDKTELTPNQKAVIKETCYLKQCEVIDKALALYTKEYNA